MREFSTEHLTVNGRPVEPTPQVKRATAVFFLVHYGGFHAAYVLFLGHKMQGVSLDARLIGLCVATFFVNHLFSFGFNLKHDRPSVPNLGRLMFMPYLRILPMHLALAFGAACATTRPGLLVFLGWKALADLAMHAVEHADPPTVPVSFGVGGGG